MLLIDLTAYSFYIVHCILCILCYIFCGLHKLLTLVMQNLVGSYTTYNALHRSCELWFRSGLSSPYPDACTLHAGNCACALADASFAALAVALLHVGCHLSLDLQLVSSCTMPYDRYCPPLSNIIALLLQHARYPLTGQPCFCWNFLCGFRQPTLLSVIWFWMQPTSLPKVHISIPCYEGNASQLRQGAVLLAFLQKASQCLFCDTWQAQSLSSLFI